MGARRQHNEGQPRRDRDVVVVLDGERLRDRRSIRRSGYDYSQFGGYFITICTQDRECLFGEIRDGLMALNDLGSIVHAEWDRSGEIRSELTLDHFIVMPNHIHGIVMITSVGSTGGSPALVTGNAPSAVGATGGSPVVGTSTRSIRPHGPSKRSLGAFVGGFKQAATIAINRARNSPGAPVWQRNYYEHVIRTEDELNRIRRYIADNPAAWPDDDDNPDVWRRNATGRPAGRPYNS